jgi:GDP-D-mannose dehydratase
MTHALITGITGFVGKHLRDELLSEGWWVFGFDTRLAGENISISNLPDCATLTRGIIKSQPDTVFHCWYYQIAMIARCFTCPISWKTFSTSTATGSILSGTTITSARLKNLQKHLRVFLPEDTKS